MYKINLIGFKEILVYCDMLCDGGGWMFLVVSYINSWIDCNVFLRNENFLNLYGDYFIFKYVDSIKNNINVVGL